MGVYRRIMEGSTGKESPRLSHSIMVPFRPASITSKLLVVTIFSAGMSCRESITIGASTSLKMALRVLSNPDSFFSYAWLEHSSANGIVHALEKGGLDEVATHCAMPSLSFHGWLPAHVLSKFIIISYFVRVPCQLSVSPSFLLSFRGAVKRWG